MNRFLTVIAFVAALMFVMVPGAASAQTIKVGFIDSQKILAEAPGTADAQRAFETDMANYRTELEALEKELQTLQDNFDRQQATLSATAKTERQNEMQQKFITYQNRRTELEETAQRRQAELVQPIMEKIQTVIDEIRAQGGYSLIFDLAAGAIIAFDPALDITAQVLAKLNTPVGG
jgi:outer membrane protein